MSRQPSWEPGWPSMPSGAANKQTTRIRPFHLNRNNTTACTASLSHDAVWFDPAQPDGRNYTPHTALLTNCSPRTERGRNHPDELNLILFKNPAEH